MTLQRIAHYQITSKLGQGGMGAVYRATDTKLDREVAIKVLPDSFANDRERVARFEREAKALASLNHPNIGGIFGLEQAGQSQALILELIEGEDLSERLKRGPLLVEDALRIGKQIAEALEVSHEKGIIHRDLKPGNIKITDDGQVKVLDFGLAKTAVASSQTDNNSPTITADFTMPGTLLGTVGYMSPEQARGRPLDKRSDIWSFGIVLFECLSGSRLFSGETVTDSIGALLHKEIDWSQLPADTPPTIHLLLNKCLVRDRKHRLRDIGDARIDLEQAIADPNSSMVRLGDVALHPPARQVSIRRHWLLPLVAGVACAAALLGWFIKPETSPPPPTPKLSEVLVEGTEPFTDLGLNNAFDLSPDGRFLVYNLNDSGKGLRLRNLVTGQDYRIPGASGRTEGHPFISPDGSRLGFVLGNELVTIPIDGGTPRKLGDSDVTSFQFAGADWNEAGEIVFANIGQPLRVVSEEGGEFSELTDLGDDLVHAFPQFLPGGDHVLFIAIVEEKEKFVGRAEVVSLSTRQRNALEIEDTVFARYCSSGHLLYAVGNDVFAVAFEHDSQTLTGPAVRVLEGVSGSGASPMQFDVAADGTLVFLPVTEAAGIPKTLLWFDSDGRMTPFTEERGDWQTFALSPDERRAAIVIENDIWILDKLDEDFEQLRPLITQDSIERSPLWSTDGESIYFFSNRESRRAIWKKKADFSETPSELICEIPSFWIAPDSVSADELWMTVIDTQFDTVVHRLNLQEANPIALSLGSGSQQDPAISPDNRWLIYTSSESGSESNIYLKPTDGSGGALLVSGDGGVDGKWSSSGDEIFYRWDYTIYSVSVTEREGQLVTGKPRKLFTSPLFADPEWTVARDSTRFLALVDAVDIDSEGQASAEPRHLKMITNWFTDLNRLVPAGKD